ncbi:MAG: hypothetical protein QXF09_05035, partial [Nitrososphaerota archaeon]
MNRLFKNIVSILLITILIFDIIAPQLIINANSSLIKNIKQSTYFKEYFSFRVRGRDVNIDTFPRFQSVEVPKEFPEFLVGIVNVDYDTDPISKTIARGVFLGMESNEIINEIISKHRSRIKTREINEYGRKRIVNTYEYSPNDKDKIIAILDDLIVDQRAKGGVAVILPVETSTITNETIIHNVFTLKSKCVNDESEDEGIIRINNKYYSLPNSIKLLKNERYFIDYVPNEGYEFDHWEVIGGRLIRPQNSSYNYLIIQNDYGEIIAFYRKIGVTTTITTSSTSILTTSKSTTSLRTTTASSSSIRITTTQTSTLRTTSIGTTSSKTEIKTTSSLSTSFTKKEENFIDSYIITPIKEYIINPIIKYIIEPINEYVVKPFVKYFIEPILKFIIQPFIEYIIKPIIEIIIKIIEIIKEIIKIILDIFNRIINTITGKNKETYTTSQISTSYSIKSKTYEITKSIEEKSTYKEYSISYEKIKYDSTKFIISYETKINTIYITKTIKTIGNKEIITTYPIITTIYENPYIITTTSSIISYKQESTSTILTTIPKKITTIYEKTITIRKTEEPITTYKQITNTITSSSLTSSTSTKQTSTIKTTSSKITTTYPLKTETIYVTIKGFTTTYKTPIYTYTTIVTTKKTTSSQNYGGGGGRREGPLLRDSILLNENVYKEFL